MNQETQTYYDLRDAADTQFKIAQTTGVEADWDKAFELEYHCSNYAYENSDLIEWRT